MNQEDLKKAAELIGQSSSFGILLPEQPDFDTLAAAEALMRILTADQKTAGLLSPAGLPARTDKNIFPNLTAPTPLLKEFIISVDTSHAPIGQLRYEKADDLNRIDIILTPKLSALDAEQVSFREGTIKCDCLIAIGIPDIEHISNIGDFPPDFFTENKIIAVDNTDAHARYGEVNIADAVRASRSELIWQIGACLPAALSPDTATLLLAGILSATDDFASPNATADTFAAAAELMRLGARHIDAQKLASPAAGRKNPDMPLGLAQLCARASVRSKHDQENGILWSFLTAEDFIKTNRTSDDIPAVLDSIRLTLPQSAAIALLWQESRHTPPEAFENETEDSIRVLIAGDQRILDAISSKESAEPYGQTNGVLLQAKFPSFRDAEEHAHSLIRTAL